MRDKDEDSILVSACSENSCQSARHENSCFVFPTYWYPILKRMSYAYFYLDYNTYRYFILVKFVLFSFLFVFVFFYKSRLWWNFQEDFSAGNVVWIELKKYSNWRKLKSNFICWEKFTDQFYELSYQKKKKSVSIFIDFPLSVSLLRVPVGIKINLFRTGFSFGS